MDREINIGLIGFGTIGSGTFQLFHEHWKEVETRVGARVNIAAVAGGSNLSAIAFNLIDWAQRTGRLGELIAAADRSSKHPDIKAFVASLHN